MEKYLHNLKLIILGLLLFVFPFFFLPTTQEFYTTNKFYLVSFAALLLLLISTLQFLVSKKLVWQKKSFDNLVLLLLTTLAISTVISSPNKIQALLSPNFGLVMMVGLAVLYFYLSRIKIPSIIYHLSSIILSLTTIVFFFQPFKNTNLPQSLQFLKNTAFTPLGSQLDLAIFLGFFVILGITRVILRAKPEESLGLSEKADIRQRSFANAQDDKKGIILNFFLLTFNLLALFLTLYSLLKPSNLEPRTSNILLPPFRLSWYAAVEILKNPLTALFGIGVDNFSAIFTQVKDFAYNQSSLWQVNSFSVSRSTLLHVLTEAGIFGLIAFGLLFFNLIRSSTKSTKFIIYYLLFIIVLFPPSLPIWFLFFITLSLIDSSSAVHTNLPEIDLSNLTPIYIGITVVSLIVIGGSSYLLGRSYAAEAYFKRSLDGLVKNNAKDVYDNMRQAVIFDPYIERFRINFAQTNLLIANNVASKATPAQPADKETPTTTANQLTDQDRQTITQAIQAAISEAKAAAALNQQKAANWENLAAIYRNVISVAQGADVWTISAYQRAIVADPQNPIYRLNLGGVYYSLNNFDQAGKLFEQSVGLKPDWTNAHYNLAWADYQKTDYQNAASEMQNVLNLIDPKTAKTDYDQAKKDLDEFKKKLPKATEETSPATQAQPSQLTLPTPPAENIQPKIQLPKEASPEAK